MHDRLQHGRQTHHLRQRRLRHRRQRLGDRLRASPAGYRPVPAISLALEPANITAVANDVGTEVIFLRQLIAQAKPEDIAIGISTSGGSRNIVMALEEARKRNLLTVALLGYDGGEILRRGWPTSRSSSTAITFREFRRSRPPFTTSFARIIGGVSSWPSLNSSAPRAARTRRKCATGWTGAARTSSSTT